jgi:small-conductance mechanosensitive channel
MSTIEGVYDGGQYMVNYENIKMMIEEQMALIKPFVEPVWNFFSDYQYLQIAFLIVMGYFFAKLVSHYVPHLLFMALDKFDKGKKFSVARDIVGLVKKLIFQLIFFFSILVSVKVTFLSTELFVTVIKSLIVIVIGIFISNALKTLLQQMAHSGGESHDDTKLIQPSTLPLFENAISIIVVLSIVYQVFSLWGIDITALLASAGIAAMAIGMAMKDTLADIIAGILILTDPPFRIGDNIQIDGRIRGTVKHIGMRNTRVFTDENIEIIVPNALIGNSQVINESSSVNKHLRIQFNVHVAYGCSTDEIRELLIDIANHSKNILKDEPIFVRVSSVNPESIRFGLYGWIATPQKKSSAIAELNEMMYMRFLKEGIEIALPRLEEVAIVSHVPMEQEMVIKDAPKQEIYIKEFPDTKQKVEVAVKEFPNTKQALFIKEIPNIFGTSGAKKLNKISKREPLKNEKKENRDEQ